MRKRNIGLLLLFFAYQFSIKAQSGFVSIGGDFSNNNGSISFSVGQIDYSSVLGGLLTQGIQQPYEYFNASTSKTTQNNLQVNVFPNPGTSIFNLNILNSENDLLTYKICDVQGKLIIQKNYQSADPIIDATTWAAGVYFISLYNHETFMGTFKIIKQ